MTKNYIHILKPTAGIFTMFVMTITAQAQQAHNVSVNNNFFEPSSLTIETGDTVIWTNASGFHNVNGTQDAYPSNPESFGNSTGEDWTYSFVFTTPGTYDYHCDPHVNLGMTGEVTVEDPEPTAVPISQANNAIRLYPNPATNYIHIEAEGLAKKDLDIQITTLNGQVVKSNRLQNTPHGVRLDVNKLPTGQYFIKIRSDGYSAQSIFGIIR